MIQYMFLSGVDSQLSTSSESSDREKDEDYVPESESNISGPDFK